MSGFGEEDHLSNLIINKDVFIPPYSWTHHLWINPPDNIFVDLHNIFLIPLFFTSFFFFLLQSSPNCPRIFLEINQITTWGKQNKRVDLRPLPVQEQKWRLQWLGLLAMQGTWLVSRGDQVMLHDSVKDRQIWVLRTSWELLWVSINLPDHRVY